MCPIHLISPSFVVYTYSCCNVVSFLHAKFTYSKSIVVFAKALSQVIVKTAGVNHSCL